MYDSASPAVDDLLENLQGGPAGPSMTPGGPPPGLLNMRGAAGATPPGMPAGGLPGGGLLSPKYAQTGNSMGDRIHRFLVDHVVGQPPAGAGEVFSPEQIEATRPSIAQTLLTHPLSGGKDIWQENMNNVLGMHELAQGMAQHQRILASRQDMTNAIGPIPGPGSTQAEMDSWLGRAYAHAAASGDIELMKEFSPARTAIAGKVTPEKVPYQLHNVISDGSYNPKFKGITVDQEKDPLTHQIIAETPVGATPMSDDAKQAAADRLAWTKQTEADRVAHYHETMAQQDAKSFQQDPAVKLMVPQAVRFSSFLNSLAKAKEGNAYSVAPLLFGMVQNNDLSAQLRQGILKNLETPAGVLAGGQQAFTKAISGKLTPTAIANIETLVRGAHAGIKAMYTQRYEALRARNPYALAHVDSPDTIFDVPGDAGEAARGATAGIRSFIPQAKK